MLLFFVHQILKKFDISTVAYKMGSDNVPSHCHVKRKSVFVPVNYYNIKISVLVT